MKSYLLDTHIFISAYLKPDSLGKAITRILKSNNPKYLSAISLIEIAQLVESKPKEFRLLVSLSTFINQALSDLNVQILAIAPEHAQRFHEIQLVNDHRDQFDRIIIAQGASTGFTVLSDDRKFPHYPIKLMADND